MEINPLNAERQELAVKYEETQRRLTLIEWAITGIVLLVLVFGGISGKIAGILDFPQPWASLVYFLILGLALGIISMPLSYYSGYILPHRYKLSVQNLSSWITDRAKSGAIALLLGALFVIFMYWTLRSFPGFWWILTGIFIILVSILLARLTPTLLISLFFKQEPLNDEELEKKLKTLADRAKSNISGIYKINFSAKSTAANAMLAGIGKTRRIILTDTLLQKYTPDEIEVILAHELGHHMLKHIPSLIFTQAITAFLTLYIAHLALYYGMGPLGYKSMSDAAAFPYIIMVIAVVSLIMTPVLNSYSRQLETGADRMALELTGNPEAFVSAMTRLTEQNLSVAHPKRWVEVLFYDHPPYFRRIQTAQQYMEAHKKEDED